MRAKQVLKGITLSIVGVATYNTIYRFLFPLHQSYPQEVMLNQLKIDLPNIHILEEDSYIKEMDQRVYPFLENIRYSGGIHIEETILYYDLFLVDDSKGTIVIVHGFNEYKEKYYELAYYFIQMEYNVIVYDQRGHGFSKRDPNEKVVDIQDFQQYIDDLEIIIDYCQSHYHLTKELILYGHSMGGTVALTFSEKYANKISRLILSSPMLNIDTSPFSRGIAYLLASAAKLIYLEGFRIPFQDAKGIHGQEYYLTNPGLSRCPIRNRYSFYLNQSLHHQVTQGGTIQWLYSSMQQMRRLANPQLLTRLDIPILIFASEEDRVVRNDGIYQICHYIENIHLIKVENAGHELYQETNKILKPYLSAMHNFLSN